MSGALLASIIASVVALALLPILFTSAKASHDLPRFWRIGLVAGSVGLTLFVLLLGLSAVDELGAVWILGAFAVAVAFGEVFYSISVWRVRQGQGWQACLREKIGTYLANHEEPAHSLDLIYRFDPATKVAVERVGPRIIVLAAVTILAAGIYVVFRLVGWY